MQDNKEKAVKAVNQAVRGGVRVDPWPVYRSYRFEDANDDTYVTVKLPAKLRAEGYRNFPLELQASAIDSYVKPPYFPLAETPELFIIFARLEATKPVWRGFVEKYGTLGPDTRRDSFSRFREEVERAERVLKLYEAATADSKQDVSVPDLRAIANIFHKDGVLQDREGWVEKVAPVCAADEALKEVDAVANDMLRSHTCAYLHRQHPGEPPIPSYSYYSLLGALWLQFFFLRTSHNGLRRCLGPGCNRVLGPGGERGKAMYKNKDHCSKACGQRRRDHDSKMLKPSEET
jgi:hypothetical protein